MHWMLLISSTNLAFSHITVEVVCHFQVLINKSHIIEHTSPSWMFWYCWDVFLFKTPVLKNRKSTMYTSIPFVLYLYEFYVLHKSRDYWRHRWFFCYQSAVSISILWDKNYRIVRDLCFPSSQWAVTARMFATLYVSTFPSISDSSIWLVNKLDGASTALRFYLGRRTNSKTSFIKQNSQSATQSVNSLNLVRNKMTFYRSSNWTDFHWRGCEVISLPRGLSGTLPVDLHSFIRIFCLSALYPSWSKFLAFSILLQEAVCFFLHASVSL